MGRLYRLFFERFHCDLATFLKRSSDREERVDVRVAMGYTLHFCIRAALSIGI